MLTRPEHLVSLSLWMRFAVCFFCYSPCFDFFSLNGQWLAKHHTHLRPHHSHSKNRNIRVLSPLISRQLRCYTMYVATFKLSGHWYDTFYSSTTTFAIGQKQRHLYLAALKITYQLCWYSRSIFNDVTKIITMSAYWGSFRGMRTKMCSDYTVIIWCMHPRQLSRYIATVHTYWRCVCSWSMIIS